MASEGLGLFLASALVGCALTNKTTSGKCCKKNLPSVTTVSAPGKALLAGGYLVLDRKFVGLTVAVTSRFYTTVRNLSEEQWSPAIAEALLASQCCCVRIESPQFHSTLTVCYDSELRSCRLLEGQPNDFVETTVWLALIYVQEQNGGKNKARAVEIKLRAHNDFYSQIDELERLGLPRISRNLATVPRFNPNPIDPSTGKVQVAKTGLGSSAALTTSLVGALLQFFEVAQLTSGPGDEKGTAAAAIAQGRAQVHNLGQISHSLAQGKVGSGFDVASAVYGTHIYRRFDPNVVDSCLAHLSSSNEPTHAQSHLRGSDAFAKSLCALVQARADPTSTGTVTWNQSVEPLQLPPGLDLVMGDVHGGSNSPLMARKVIEWRKQQSIVAEQVYADLGATNASICDTMRSLNKLAAMDISVYNTGLQWYIDHEETLRVSALLPGTLDASAAKVVTELCQLHQLFAKSRRLLRGIGESAGVPIEPTCQTALIDATVKVKGVLCAGVPGAGGIDALFAIVLQANNNNNSSSGSSSNASRDRVESLWSTWGPASEGYKVTTDSTIDKVCPLLLHAAGCGDDSNGAAGVRVEKDIQW